MPKRVFLHQHSLVCSVGSLRFSYSAQEGRETSKLTETIHKQRHDYRRTLLCYQVEPGANAWSLRYELPNANVLATRARSEHLKCRQELEEALG